jgi:subtilisin family serine protease
MKNKFYLSALRICLVCMLVASAGLVAFAQSNAKGIVPGKMLVKFKSDNVSRIENIAKELDKGMIAGQFKTGVSGFDVTAKKYKASGMRRVFPNAGRMEAKQRKYGLNLWYVVDIDVTSSVSNAVNEMKKTGDLMTAQPVYEIKLIQPKYPAKPVSSPRNALRPLSPLQVNDPMYGLQWDLKNTTQQGGYAGADINVEDAWKVNAGNPNVIVAVVDMGVDYTHEDLAANMWINEAEKNGIEGIDDDHNGYVDDIYGYDFADNTGNIVIGDHGTHVAGTIAAVNNNGTGIAGIAGGTGSGDGARIMTTEIFGNNTGGNAAAIVYGANNGAVISQNSWGYTYPGVYDQSVLDAIDYFTKEAGLDENGHQVGPMNGGVVIFAAGNDNWDDAYYPGYYENAISVGATSVFDNKSYYSNYGKWVDISAPGGEMYSGDDPRGILSTLPGNHYGYFQGTSMACPHVSGIAALIVSEYGKSGFTNTDLKNRLFKTASPFLGMNAAYKDLMGIGRANAGKALQPDDAIPPARITNLAGVSNTPNSIDLQWTAPSDPDNGKAESYFVYYSAKPIDSLLLDSAFRIIIPSAKDAGQAETINVAGLFPSTKYYVAIVAKDLWANRSYFSNIATITTQPGPLVAANPTSLEINVDASSNTVNNGIVSLLNKGLGALTWNGSMVPVSSSWANTTGFNDTMQYVRGDWPNYFLGDDQAVPFSAATRFDVSAAKGFNLTHVASFIQTQGITQPVVFYIIKGGDDPSKGKLLLKQLVTPAESWGVLETIKLNGMYKFQQGEWFWVVFEYHEDFTYAQGAFDYNQMPDYFLTSSNRGKTWGPIASLYKPVAWFMQALSNEGSLEGVTLNPTSGKVNPNSNTPLTITANATTLRNGVYKWKLELNSNDLNQPVLEVPVTVNVTGQKAVMVTKQPLAEFENVFIGKSKEVSIKIYNLGLGEMKSFTFTSNNNLFTQVSLPDNINPGDSADVVISFTPSGTGLQTAKIIIGTNAGSLTLAGTGSGIKPPVMTLSAVPVQIVAKADSTASNKITISNRKGKYPLSYSFPDYTAQVKAQKMGLLNQGAEAFGNYVWIDSKEPGGPIYTWNEISSSGVDITKQLAVNKNGLQYFKLGFPMRVYNDTITGLNVTNQGLLALSDVQGFNSSIIELPYKGDAIKGCIAPLWYNTFDGEINGREDMRVYVKQEPGKFIVQYNDMVYYAPGWFGGTDNYGKATFQVVLYSDGKVEVNYKSVQSAFWPSYSIIGIENKDETKGFNIPPSTLNLEDNTTLWMVPIQPNFIKDVKPFNGVVPMGDTVSINITADAKGMTDGIYNRDLTLTSNDPFNERTDVPVKLTVTGISGLMKQTDSLNYGSVINKSKNKKEAIFFNAGTKPVSIKKIQSSSPAFVVTMEPVIVPAYSEVHIPVSFEPTNTGDFNGKLTINTDNAAQAKFIVVLTGTATAAPEFSYSITGGQDKSLNVGESKPESLTLTNNGKVDMKVAIETPQWLLMKADSAGTRNGLPGANSYSVHKNIGDTSASYNWIELSKGLGRHSQVRLDLLPTQKIQLPFEFPYYNKKYSSLYIWVMGSLILSPDQDIPGFGIAIPSPAGPNGLIAPLYETLFPNFDQNGNFTGDIYYYSDSEKLVVQYDNMQRAAPFIEGYATFEVILYKDGRIKFQYKEGEVANWTIRSSVAIENEDGTDGSSIYNQTLWYKDRSAIDIVPTKSFTVPAGKSVTVPFTWTTQSMTDGLYSDKLVINTNDPLNAAVKIPLQLAVTGGETTYKTTDTLNFGKMVAFENEGLGWNAVKKIVSFTNTGTQPITINDITLSKPDFMRLEEYNTYPVIVGAGETKNYTLNFAPDTTFSKVKEQVTFVTDLATTLEVIVPITALVSKPPVATVDSEYISVTMQKNETTKRKFQLQNLTGSTGLDYDLEVLYMRQGINYSSAPVVKATVKEEKTPAYKITGGSIIASTAMPLTTTPYGVNGSFTDSLSYTEKNPASGIYYMGFGTDAGFFATAHFKAGKDGFNLSHVSDIYRTDVMIDYKGKVVIKLGNDINTAKTIYQQGIALPADTVGRSIMVKLDSSILMYPNEDFWVEFQFAEGMHLPQAFQFVDNDKVLPDVFYYISNEYPVYRPIFQPQRFYIAAYEETDKKSGGWIELPQVSGTVAKGSQRPINFTVKGKELQSIDASARVTIKNNDPFNSKQFVLVRARIDQAPYLTDHDTILVNEGDTLRYAIPVVDYEKGDISVVLKNASSIAKIEKVNTVNYLVYKPGYFDEGVHTFTIEPKDNFGNKTTDSVVVKVLNTNRAPIGKKLRQLITYTGNVTPLSLDTMFTEPDKEPMLFAFEGDSTKLAKVLTENNGTVRIIAEDTGTVLLRFAATDPFMAKATDSILLTIRKNTPPVAKGFPVQILEMGTSATILGLENLFNDTDGDALKYSFTIDSAQFVGLTIENGNLKMLPKKVGTAKVKVTANDGKGGVTVSEFQIKVLDVKGNVIKDYNITVGPNPVHSLGLIRFELGTRKRVKIDIVNLAGNVMKVLFDGHKDSGRHSMVANFSNLMPGNYLVRFNIDGEEGSIQITKL